MTTRPEAWEQPGRRLPTLDDCVEGIVGWRDRPNGAAEATVQCAVCHITYTDLAIIAVGTINHAASGSRGIVPYKRCPGCRDADMHPDGNDAS